MTSRLVLVESCCDKGAEWGDWRIAAWTISSANLSQGTWTTKSLVFHIQFPFWCFLVWKVHHDGTSQLCRVTQTMMFLESVSASLSVTSRLSHSLLSELVCTSTAATTTATVVATASHKLATHLLFAPVALQPMCSVYYKSTIAQVDTGQFTEWSFQLFSE